MIKNIILDYGGVIINLNYQNTANAFKALGAKNFDEVFSQWKQQEIFDLLDTGKISDQDFFIKLKLDLNLNCAIHEIEHAWNAMLLYIPPARIDLLVQLKQQYNLFLLSNTNHIHLKQISKYLLQQFGLNDISVCFHKAYYSCNYGLRKPDAAFYNLVLNENKLNPAETLFVDDNFQNIESANALHLHAKLLVNEELGDLLKRELK